MKKLILVLVLLLFAFLLLSCENRNCLNHELIEDHEIKPTCVSTGLTSGFHCLKCGEIIQKQNEIARLEHDIVLDPQREPTCSDTGLTAGQHCGICNMTIIAQKPIETVEHEYDEHGKCVWCGVVKQVKISFVYPDGNVITEVIANFGDCVDIPNSIDGTDINIIGYEGNVDDIKEDGVVTILFEYDVKFEDNICSLIKYNGSNSVVVTPTIYQGVPITRIESDTFKCCNFIKKITITDNYSFLGKCLFSDCTALEYISIPFGGYMETSGTTIIEHPIGYYFSNVETDGLKTISQPIKTTKDGKDMLTFKDYYFPKSIIELHITNNYVTFGALYDLWCYSYVEKQVSYISNGAFSNAGTVICLSNNYHYIDGLLLSNDFKNVISINDKAWGFDTIYLPYGIEKIGSYAFYNTKKVKTVRIPITCISIENNAFVNCELLSDLIIDNESIDFSTYAMINCSSVKDIVKKNRDFEFQVDDSLDMSEQLLSLMDFFGNWEMGTIENLVKNTNGNKPLDVRPQNGELSYFLSKTRYYSNLRTSELQVNRYVTLTYFARNDWVYNIAQIDDNLIAVVLKLTSNDNDIYVVCLCQRKVYDRVAEADDFDYHYTYKLSETWDVVNETYFIHNKLSFEDYKEIKVGCSIDDFKKIDDFVGHVGDRSINQLQIGNNSDNSISSYYKLLTDGVLNVEYDVNENTITSISFFEYSDNMPKGINIHNPDIINSIFPG